MDGVPEINSRVFSERRRVIGRKVIEVLRLLLQGGGKLGNIYLITVG
jgi:hypothetical protein